MNILGIGPIEFALIFMIALIIAGPKRMLGWAYIMGKYTARLRAMWAEAMAGIQKEINAAGVDLELPKDLPTRGEINRLAGKVLQPVSDPLKQAVDQMKTEQRTIREATTLKPLPRPTAPSISANGQKAATTSPNDPTQSGFGTWSGSGKQED
ncbi:MAG: hypothetical protein SF029_19815 [bacterium]|nr:hypothetical protein [bacterium]